MARPSSITPHLVGEPMRLGPSVRTFADLVDRLELARGGAPRVVRLAPGAVLCLVPGEGRPCALHWVELPHAPLLGPGGEAVDLAVVLTAPLHESGLVLHLAARLAACLRHSDLRARARGAPGREALAAHIAAVEGAAGAVALPADEVLELLGARAEGHTEAEAARRLASAGPNRIERLRRRSLAAGLLEPLTSFFAMLLWVGGAFAMLAGMPQLGWAIFVVILVNGLFSFLQEYRAERAIEALQDLLPHQVTVLRDGHETSVPATTLVPGDVVALEAGDQVPADLRLLHADALEVDQSSLTGESKPVFKAAGLIDGPHRLPSFERHESLFAGSAVVAGLARGVVTATGMATEIGAIAHATQAIAEEASPLQREMARVTRLVTLLAVGFGAIFFALGVTARDMPLHDGFLFALGVIVANVPEGLLPTLTLALALGAQRMARRGILVKRLSAVEGLGATTVICTDKTGTLTENRMTVRSVLVAGEVRPASAAGDGAVTELLRAAALASLASAERGDPTEIAIVRAARALDPALDSLRDLSPAVATLPFDSFRKRMTVLRTDRSAGGATRAWVKGAANELLPRCSTVCWNDRPHLLDQSLRDQILADHDRLAAEGLRVLAVARRAVTDAVEPPSPTSIERDLELVGLIALWDPPRPEVPGAVATALRAGIRVIMVTGDNGLTARAIARQIGLPVTRVVAGQELERLGRDDLHKLVREPGVLFARTSPRHKLAIVIALRELGEVVTVTGDGVNDAPALKAAATGVAMGGRGSDVAKEASGIVITDDNFASIVDAVGHGRAIYANLGKFVTYIFASNVPELVPFLAFVFLGIPLPLAVMQILAVDLGTDLLPALALGAEPAEPGLMDRPPRKPSERLLGSGRLLRAYGFLGAAEAALAMLAFFWTYWLDGWRPGMAMAASGELYLRATTMTLAGIVACQVGNLFACRTERESVFRVGLFRNRLVLIGIAAEVAILVGLIAVPALRHAFGLAPPAFREWRLLLAFPVVMLALEEGRKWLVRRRPA